MTIPAGFRLGPYEVISPLGAGGMGEVYRARDTRLSREVAIKVLPSELSSDADRLRRFEREARAASSLSHPNIVTIYEVARIDSTSFIAMELVGGKTLRERMAGGPVPLRKLLGLAAQIADGLARAHASGIVHRDLKPENVMVTEEGLVKILDFGLAKLTHPEIESGQTQEAPTVSAATRPGIAMGTVGYMSPEQASGHPVDFRSDQFSFGSVLYEMATGKPSFKRPTTAQTLAAIIQDEPEPIAVLAPKTPAPLRWIIDRCVSKEPKGRYASTEDLARELRDLRDHVSELSASAGIAIEAARPRRPWRALVAALFLLAGAAIGWLAHRARPVPPVYHRLTFRHGTLGSARFAPDGQTAIYDAQWEGQESGVFSTRLDSFESAPLPLPSASLAAVSSSGKIAMLVPPTGGPVHGLTGTLVEVALAGGTPREILESVSFADYAPDGTSLAVVHTVSGRDRLEFPIGRVLYEAMPGGGLSELRFSPRGDGIAFFAGPPGPPGDPPSLLFVDLAGHALVLSHGDWDVAFGLAWNPRLDELWFAPRPLRVRAGPEVWAASRSGRQRVVTRAPGQFVTQDISRDGRVLAERLEWRKSLVCLPPGADKEVDLGWLDFSDNSSLSEDGRMILFTEWGVSGGAQGKVYVRKTDGSPAFQVGDGFGLALSPDKKWIVAKQLTAAGSPNRLVLLPNGAGEPKTLGALGMAYGEARWVQDGKRVLFSADRPGRKTTLFLQDVDGGAPRPVSPEGVGIGPVSPDGKFVVGQGPGGAVFLYPLEGGQPRPLPGIGPEDELVGWDKSGSTLYLARAGKSYRVERYEVASGSRSFWKELTPPDPSGIRNLCCLALTPSGDSYVYSVWRDQSALYLVEGLE